MARTNVPACVGIGAALMYLFDPQQGRRRRNDLRARLEAARRKVLHGTDAVVRDATNRTHGMLVETSQWLQSQKRRLESRAANDAGDLARTLASKARASVPPWRRARWSPTQRALGGMMGAGLATSGCVRGGIVGVAMSIVGIGLIARTAANEELGSLARKMSDNLRRLESQIESLSTQDVTPAPSRGDMDRGAASGSTAQ